jgi:hypothetical protein
MTRKCGKNRYFLDRILLARTLQKTWILIALSKLLVLLAEIVRCWAK